MPSPHRDEKAVMTTMSGQCLCSAVKFTAESVETHHHVCHCGMCRRWGGGPSFGASASGVKFEGEENIARYASSEWGERGFCRTCGSHLFYFLKPANQYILFVGAFDDASPFTIASEIYVDRKPPGYDLAGDRPRLTEEEFLARFQTGG
jgi:hypothetical protein